MAQLVDPKFLLVKHSEGWNVDRCALWMEQNNQHHDWCYPVSGQPFPDLADYSGVIIFGGANSANDCNTQDWIRAELKFIESCLKVDIPYVGICLGAQMLAKVLGAPVTKHPDELNEIGFYEVKPTEQSGNYLKEPLEILQWHREGFELPSGATQLAYSERFPNQAYKLSDHVHGMQFHPEVNLAALRIWHERNSKREVGRLNDEQRAQQVADALRCEPAITEWFGNFLSTWTGVAAAKAAA